MNGLLQRSVDCGAENNAAPALSGNQALSPATQESGINNTGGVLQMKKIVVVAALAVFALGAVVGRASVPAPNGPRAEVFAPASVLSHPHLLTESYAAI